MPNVLATSCETRASRQLSDLISAVRRVIQAEAGLRQTGSAVANLLRPCLGSDNFLSAEQMASSGETYRQHILHVEPDGSFSVVSLVWMPGQRTPIHDHVSWCVVGVHRGEEHETIYRRLGDGDAAHLVVAGHNISAVGTVAALVPPGDIHRVANGGHELAVSLHIYGADIGVLGSSIRRRYNLEVRRLAGSSVASVN